MPPSRALAALAVLAFAACGAPGSGVDAGPDAAAPRDAGLLDSGAFLPPDGGSPDSGYDAGEADAGRLVTLSHARELRGLWVATVSNLDFPSAPAEGPDAGVAELAHLVDLAARHGFNAIFFQVRPESDALYRSAREPWSRFLTGTQGRDPGYDPLGVLITLAHAQAIEVHAWINPYRAKVSSDSMVTPSHVSRVLSAHAITYGAGTVMDPSSEAVRDWVVSELDDLVRSYDVDGVHFDDTFYPYPIAGTPFPDDPQYAAYQADGGSLSKLDWRRNQVNQLIQGAARVIAARKPFVRFGISPFGIYRPGQPEGASGFDAYDGLACDPLTWLSRGWVDYLAPQLYWPTTQAGQEFGALITWWSAQVSDGQNIFAGHALYRLGSGSAWTLEELRNQVALTRAQSPRAGGSLWFRYAQLRDDLEGVQAMFAADLYSRPALPPPVARAGDAPTPPPNTEQNGRTVVLSHSAVSALRAFAVYRQEAGSWQLDRVVSAHTAQLTLPSGRWAIAAVNRADVESAAVVVDVP